MGQFKSAKKKDGLGFLVAAPEALDGDQVAVKNYRVKNTEKWEDGTVTDVRTSWRRDERGTVMTWHLYDVTLHRRSNEGGYVRLTVGDGDIRLMIAKQFKKQSGRKK